MWIKAEMDGTLLSITRPNPARIEDANFFTIRSIDDGSIEVEYTNLFKYESVGVFRYREWVEIGVQAGWTRTTTEINLFADSV
jgi:hypothetical protein